MNYKCKICNYGWKSRVEKPAQCPRCKRYDWDKDTKDEDYSEKND